MLSGVHLILFFSSLFFSPVFSSEGDRSPLYQKCLTNCMKANCTEDGVSFTPETAALQETGAWALLWSCRDDCRYHCMWRTVAGFQERNIRVPKFHGKWPFQRIWGVQEPASALFSLLNLAAHVHMAIKMWRDRRFSVKETPLLLFWQLFAAVCVHAWLWSTVFHTRDTAFTEFMDYACALSMVTALFVAAIVRVLRSRPVLSTVILTVTLLYFMEHVKYLYRGTIDYGYNMTVNICFGVCGSVLWLFWAVLSLRRRRRPHAARLAAFVLCSGGALALELFDFPPRAQLDAHALWHLATAPLPLLFYRFVIEDMDYLQTTEIADKKTATKLA